jgi:hypothetical protein
MYLNYSSNNIINLSFPENEIIFKNKSNLNSETLDKEIIIPFNTYPTDLEERLINLEDAEITIKNICSNNPCVGLDPLNKEIKNKNTKKIKYGF